MRATCAPRARAADVGDVRLRIAAAGEPVVHRGQQLEVSFSVGHAARAPGAGDAALFKRADLALYRDKADGRARAHADRLRGPGAG